MNSFISGRIYVASCVSENYSGLFVSGIESNSADKCIILYVKLQQTFSPVKFYCLQYDINKVQYENCEYEKSS